MSSEKGNPNAPLPPIHGKPLTTHKLEGTDDWTVPESIKQNPLFIEVEGNVIVALKKLDVAMRQQKLGGILSGKLPNTLFGRRLSTGQLGLWDFAGSPQVCTTPGRYINFHPSVRFYKSVDITEQLEFQSLTIALVGQSEALVIQDPSNKVFIVRNGGFVAYGAYGRFKILAVVDTLKLGEENAISEPGTDRILGYKKEVTSDVIVGGRNVPVVVATFLNVPANNVAILQQGNTLICLEAGQHVITNPHTTFRAFMSLGERQYGFKTQPAYTIEGVPVVLDLNLRYRIFDPVVLTEHYGDALQALVNPAQTAVNGVVSRLSYQQFMRAQKVAGDIPDNNHVPWLEAFKSECIHELAGLAKGHGIDVLGFEVMDRRLEGALGKDLEKQAETVLQNQMDATQIDLKNQIQKRKQEGLLQVMQIENEQKRAVSDTTYYQTTREADSAYYLAKKQAQAQAETSALITQQENLNLISKAQAAAETSQLQTVQEVRNILSLAEAKKKEIEMQGQAYASVTSVHAQRIQLSNLEIEKRKVMPQKTVWFESTAAGVQSGVQSGFSVAEGVALSNQNQ